MAALSCLADLPLGHSSCEGRVAPRPLPSLRYTLFTKQLLNIFCTCFHTYKMETTPTLKHCSQKPNNTCELSIQVPSLKDMLNQWYYSIGPTLHQAELLHFQTSQLLLLPCWLYRLQEMGKLIIGTRDSHTMPP